MTSSAVTLAGLTASGMRRALLTGCAALAAFASTAFAQSPVLTRAHAHNDYEHARPLLDALDNGFNSVEADVHLVDGELYVAHDRSAIRPERTLEALYLAPLRSRIRANGGHVYPDAPPLLLLIDLKTDSTATYRVLDRLLGRYPDILTRFSGDSVAPGPVTAVISGERPEGLMRTAPLRFAAFDGRLPDLSRRNPPTPSFMPLVSESWAKVTRWNGAGEPPPGLSDELSRLSGLAHAQGRRLRFWGTPDTPAAWRLLFDADVDLINTDDLPGLQAFLVASRGDAETRRKEARF